MPEKTKPFIQPNKRRKSQAALTAPFKTLIANRQQHLPYRVK
ncbi:hypothetical protein l13_19690 [Neisseria weaveri ATCC 51223]|nr:hypothetical protein l13_19690 [Neisseria weaveri ATCC 51223]